MFFKMSVVILHSLMDHMDKNNEKMPNFNNFPLVLIFRDTNRWYATSTKPSTNIMIQSANGRILSVIMWAGSENSLPT